jgi:hypothetical protein
MSDEMSSERPLVTESNKDRIRAGVTGHNVRYVLIISCAMVIVALIDIAFVVRPRKPRAAPGRPPREPKRLSSTPIGGTCDH